MRNDKTGKVERNEEKVKKTKMNNLREYAHKITGESNVPAAKFHPHFCSEPNRIYS
jgi:hypothetical protein